MLAFVGLFVMGLDRRVVSDPLSTFVTALSSFTRGDALIIGAAALYTLHVVRLGVYAKETTPMKLAASKATAETIFSVLLVGGLASLSSVLGEGSGLLGFASSTGTEIVNFFSSFKTGLTNGSLTLPVLMPAIGAVFWTGWVTCAYTIYAQSFGQSRVSPTGANLIYTFQPIFTALFGWLLLGETMGASGFVGGAIIAFSVYVVASASFDEEGVDIGDGEYAASLVDSAATNDMFRANNDTETRSLGS
jgi:drug/metabolite transporter (DMT)-like permease